MAKFKFFSVGGEADTDTNTNLANTDLSNSATRTFDVNGNTLTFLNGATNIIQLDNSDNTLKIGGATPYEMPTTRANGEDKILISTDGSGNTDFKEVYAYSSMSFIGRDTSLADGNFCLFSNAGVLDIGGGSSVAFSSVTRATPIIPSSTTSVYYRAKAGLSVSQTSPTNVGLVMIEIEPNATTSFDFTAGTQTPLGDFTTGTADTLYTTAFILNTDTLMDEGKWYFFGIKNGSGGTLTNLAVWITITWYDRVWTK